LTFYAKVHARRELSNQGYSFRQINEAMQHVDGQAVSAAAMMAGPEVEGAVGKLGDGTILQAILDFLKSPQGQQLIDALVKMLLALLTGL
jgi:hypothetical protein